MSTKLHAEILTDLSSRKSWEEKQRIYYEMRHQGLRRQSKPFPGAADMHYPLIDGLVDKFKPFFFSQIFGNDTVARFTAMQQEAMAYASDVAEWFDWQLTQQSNLFDESLSLIDAMLMAGGAPLKTTWSEAHNAVRFEAVEPINLIVPEDTADLDEADRICHVMPFSVEAYKRDGRYLADDDTIARIKGRGSSEHDTGDRLGEKYRREGITDTKDGIVVWEVYTPQDRGQWVVETFSPVAPDLDLREPYVLPAEYAGQPFVWFPLEIKDKGLFASRGIAERGGPFEAYACKVWNEKADAMTFYNRPLFTRDGDLGNLAQSDLRPGSVIPGGLRRVEMGSVPMDFDQELYSTRMVAEQLFAVPDFGLGQPTAQDKRKTATEVQYMAGLMAMSTDLRAWIFRWALTRVYKRAWALLKVRGAQSLAYATQGKSAQLNSQLLQANFDVRPDGSPDGWNKNQRLARARDRYGNYFGKPFINQAELAKHTLEEDDPRVARRLYQEPQVTAAEQGEDQAMECLLLEAGYPAMVQIADDHNAHLEIIAGRLQQHAQGLAAPMIPNAANAYVKHIGEHIKMLAQNDASAAGAWQRRLMPFLAPLQRLGNPQPQPPPEAVPQPMPQEAIA